MREIMLPGQVESWIFILDLNKKGIFSLPTAVTISTVETNSYRLLIAVEEDDWLLAEQLQRPLMGDACGE